MKEKNKLIIVEGSGSACPERVFFTEPGIGKVYLLYLSSLAKAQEYSSRLRELIEGRVDIEIINCKEMVDFYRLRQKLLDFISSLPAQIKISNLKLTQYLKIDGLNLWWTSGIVERTAYKRDLLQNLYYLSAVRAAIQEKGVSSVWFQVDSKKLECDLLSLLKEFRIRFYRRRSNKRLRSIVYRLNLWKSWLLFFSAHLFYSIYFKMICPNWLKRLQTESGKKDIHLFWTYFPSEVGFKDNVPQARIYADLPVFLSEKLGGEDYYLTYIAPLSLFQFREILRGVRKFWANGLKLIPMDVFVSLPELFKVFLSPERHWKYFRLKSSSLYRKVFIVDGIDMYHTFDEVIRDSLVGVEAYTNLFYYYVFRRFSSIYGKGIFQVVYPLEFHNWEVALISGVRSADADISIVGLQQSAPNPILLSFYFTPEMFRDKEDCYPLPDLILCSGQIYKDLLVSGGIDSQRIEVLGHIANQYLKALPLTENEKERMRLNAGLPRDKKICLVAGSISLPLNEGIIYMLKDIIPSLPDILFLIKAHPQCPLGQLSAKYNLIALKNVKFIDTPISELLIVSDYFLSTSTSVSQEALCAGVAQVNLDVGGLPFASPLHLLPGFISDVQTAEQLMDLFKDPERYSLPAQKSCLFIGDPQVNPYQNFLDIINRRLFNRSCFRKEKKDNESDYHCRRKGLTLESLNQ